MSLQQYLNRNIDVLAFTGAKPAGEVLLNQALATEDHSGFVCTGIQQLAQCFLLELLTEKGTWTFAAARGTDFMRQLRNGSLLSELDVIQAFNLALVDIERALLNTENDQTPADERYAGAQLLGLTVMPGFVSLRVRIDSRAGATRELILPLPTTV